MKVLIACEESQRVCIAFRKRGHDAFSCDLKPCSGGHPEWHIRQNCLQVLNGRCQFKTCNGDSYFVDRWDLIIAHPPCTYLANSGASYLDIERYGDYAKERLKKRDEAIQFVLKIWNCDCDKVCIENPLGFIQEVMPYSQLIQPYYFGDPEKKSTLLWLRGLPLLKIDRRKFVKPIMVYSHYESTFVPRWKEKTRLFPNELRQTLRSKTFPGIAEAFAENWG